MISRYHCTVVYHDAAHIACAAPAQLMVCASAGMIPPIESSLMLLLIALWATKYMVPGGAVLGNVHGWRLLDIERCALSNALEARESTSMKFCRDRA